LLIKTDFSGNTLWSKLLSNATEAYSNSGNAVVEVPDGFAIAGSTDAAGSDDFLLVKTDFSGNQIWNKTYGNTSSESASSLVYTGDGYLLAGITSAGMGDIWIVKTDLSGNMLWDKRIGQDTTQESLGKIIQTDGGFALAGTTNSTGNDDYWLVFLADDSSPISIDDYDGLWHTSDFTVNLSAIDDLTYTTNTYYRINDGPTKTIGVNGQPQINTEGLNNRVEYWSIDSLGHEESPHQIVTGVKLDKTSPTGSIVINQGAALTASQSVSLSLTFSDLNSGVSQIRFSNDGVWDTESWESATSSKAWSLTSGDGLKNVYYQIKDNAGFTVTYLDSITLQSEQVTPTPSPTAEPTEEPTRL